MLEEKDENFPLMKLPTLAFLLGILFSIRFILSVVSVKLQILTATLLILPLAHLFYSAYFFQCNCDFC